jgi:hypothetical protein
MPANSSKKPVYRLASLSTGTPSAVANPQQAGVGAESERPPSALSSGAETAKTNSLGFGATLAPPLGAKAGDCRLYRARRPLLPAFRLRQIARQIAPPGRLCAWRGLGR